MQKNFANLSFLDKVVLEYSNFNLEENVKAEINEDLKGLKESFDRYFSRGDQEEPKTWIANPFTFKLKKVGDEDKDKDHLIEIQAYQSMNLLYEFSLLETFWCSI